MDLNAYWQENRRFLLAVGAGLVAFLIGRLAIASFVGDDLQAARRDLRAAQQALAEPMFQQTDLAAAREQNESLRAAVDALRAAGDFEPRPEFALRPDGGSPSNQYFGAVARVREELVPLAARSGLAIPGELGLPALAPTREAEITRYLEALDVIDGVVRLCIEAGCRRVDEIRIALDPRLLSGKALGSIESTKVQITLTGSPQPLTRLLALTQEPRLGRVHQVESAEMQLSRVKTDEARLDLVLLVTHLHGLPGDDGGAGEGGT